MKTLLRLSSTIILTIVATNWIVAYYENKNDNKILTFKIIIETNIKGFFNKKLKYHEITYT